MDISQSGNKLRFYLPEKHGQKFSLIAKLCLKDLEKSKLCIGFVEEYDSNSLGTWEDTS